MLSRGHSLIYAYGEGASRKKWVDEGMVVGSSRILEKVAVKSLMTFFGSFKLDAG